MSETSYVKMVSANLVNMEREIPEAGTNFFPESALPWNISCF